MGETVLCLLLWVGPPGGEYSGCRDLRLWSKTTFQISSKKVDRSPQGLDLPTFVYIYIHAHRNILIFQYIYIFGFLQGRNNKKSWQTDGGTYASFTGARLDLDAAAPQRLL